MEKTYPDRLSYKLLKELKRNYEDFNDHQDLDRLRQEGRDLLKKYNDPTSFDKFSKANQGVNDLKVDM